MFSPNPPRCTYCGSTSSWSAEKTDTIEMPERHPCPHCDQETAVWEGDGVDQLEHAVGMRWIAPEPLM